MKKTLIALTILSFGAATAQAATTPTLTPDQQAAINQMTQQIQNAANNGGKHQRGTINAAKGASMGAMAGVAASMISAMMGGLMSDALNAFGAVQSSQTQGTMAVNNLFNQYNQSLASFMRNLEITKAQQDYAYQSASFNQLGGNTTSVCAGSGASALANTSGNGIPSGKLPSITSTPGTPVSKTDQMNQWVSDANNGLMPDADSLFEGSPYYTDDQVAVTIRALTLPFGPSPVTASGANTPAGTAYAAEAKVANSYISLASNAMKVVSDYNRPIKGLTDAQVASIAALVQAQPISLPASQNDIMDMLVNGVYANKDWASWLNQAGEPGAIKALSAMHAIDLSQQQRHRELLAQLTTIMAARQSIQAQVIADHANDTIAPVTAQSARGVTE